MLAACVQKFLLFACKRSHTLLCFVALRRDRLELLLLRVNLILMRRCKREQFLHAGLRSRDFIRQGSEVRLQIPAFSVETFHLGLRGGLAGGQGSVVMEQRLITRLRLFQGLRGGAQFLLALARSGCR